MVKSRPLQVGMLRSCCLDRQPDFLNDPKGLLYAATILNVSERCLHKLSNGIPYAGTDRENADHLL